MAITTIYDPARPNSVGRPGPKQRLRIMAASGQPCRGGEVGEVWLSTPGAPMRSYYRDPRATAAVFGHGWLRTEDLGYVDSDGFLHLTGRRSDLVITGGHNVSSVEVEAVLHECPAVAEAAVTGVPHEILGEQVAAAVVLRAPIAASDLKTFMRERLTHYAVPQTIIFLDRLPRNVSGKVIMSELRAHFVLDLARHLISPRTPTEMGIAAIWAEVLALEEVSVEDRFVDLGGQSISALQVIAGIQERYGALLDFDTIAEAETVAALAAVVDRLLSGERTAPPGQTKVHEAPPRRTTRHG